jgi:hypothetical protein
VGFYAVGKWLAMLTNLADLVMMWIAWMGVGMSFVLFTLLITNKEIHQ